MNFFRSVWWPWSEERKAIEAADALSRQTHDPRAELEELLSSPMARSALASVERAKKMADTLVVLQRTVRNLKLK